MATSNTRPHQTVRCLEVPDAIAGRPNIAGEPLPIRIWARVKTVRDTANGLLPQPIVIERALLRNQHAEVALYLSKLAPIFQRGQRFEGEILEAHSSRSGALYALSQQRAQEWNQFLNDYAEFADATRELRDRLHLSLDDGPTVRMYERALIDPLSVTMAEASLGWEVNAPPGVIAPSEQQRRAEHMESLEAVVDSLDLTALFARAQHTQPADRRILSRQPIRPEDWRAAHPWEAPHPTTCTHALSPERSRQAPARTPRPSAAPDTPPGYPAVPGLMDALVEERRMTLLREIRRQASALAVFRRADYSRARDRYLEAVAQRFRRLGGSDAGAAPASIVLESRFLLGGMHANRSGKTSLEVRLQRLGTAWRGAPLWMKLGLGATTVAASFTGGAPAAIGAGVALAARGLGSLALVDVTWQRAEAALLRRRLRGGNDLRSLGNAAWKLERTSAGAGASAGLREREKAAARTIQEGIRTRLRCDADLGQLVDGAVRAARMRPLHLLGKLGLAAAATVAMSTDAARNLFQQTRLGIGRLFGFGPDLPVAVPTPPDVPSQDVVPRFAPAPFSSPTPVHPVPLHREIAVRLSPTHTPSPVPTPTPGVTLAPTPAPTLVPTPLPAQVPVPSPTVLPPQIAGPSLCPPDGASAGVVFASNHHTPASLRLTFAAEAAHNCPDRLLRAPVLREFARRGIDIDHLTRADQGRILNATANLTRHLGLGNHVVPGQIVDVPQELLHADVSRSLGRTLPGAEAFTARVSWPTWVERARTGADHVRDSVRSAMGRALGSRV